ncbi:MAG TPA: hypothetical protein VHF22_11265 [Planctomycetota bacterium]|nr:hypothetical protein [Planctomycetota bacterium]
MAVARAFVLAEGASARLGTTASAALAAIAARGQFVAQGFGTMLASLPGAAAQSASLVYARYVSVFEAVAQASQGATAVAAKAFGDLGASVENVGAAGARASLALERAGQSGTKAGASIQKAMDAAQDRVGKTFDQMQAAGEGAASGIKAAFSGVGLAIVGAVGAGLYGLVQHAARIGGIEKSFDHLADSVGGAEVVLQRLREASGGAIDGLTLMEGANRLLIQDFGITTEQMAQLAAMATNLGQATGVTAKEAFEDLAQAVQSGHVRMAEHIGVTLDVEEAVRRYAAANGLAAEEIDNRTRRQIALNELLKVGAQAEEKLGVTGNATATPIEKLSTLWGDFMEKIEKGIAENPSVVRALEALSGAAMHLIGALVPVVTRIAEIIEKLGEMKLLMPAIEAFVGGKLFGAIGGLLEKIPIVGKLLEGLGVSNLFGLGGAIGGALAGFSYEGLPAAAPAPPPGPRAQLNLPGHVASVNAPIHIGVPLHDETIDRTAHEAGRQVAQVMRRRIDDVRGSLTRGLESGLDSMFANSFEA